VIKRHFLAFIMCQEILDGEIWGEKKIEKKKQIMLLTGDEGEIWEEKLKIK
jgi:hypothetical protein